MELYRKYRPTDFFQMVGNGTELDILTKLLSEKTKPHTYLISGPFGTGKTTIARIAAIKYLGVQDDMCIREINNASETGVDKVRDIIEQMRYMPAIGNSVVYIFDECANLSKAACEALLKPTEDCPEHVYFFFCTTEPEKMNKALRSRCVEIRTKLFSKDELCTILKLAVKKEGIVMDSENLKLIALKAEGSARTAYELLEKCKLVDQDKIALVLDENDPEKETCINLCRALLQGSSWKEIGAILPDLKNDNMETIRRTVLGYSAAVLIKSGNPRAAHVMQCFGTFFQNGYNDLMLSCFQAVEGK